MTFSYRSGSAYVNSPEPAFIAADLGSSDSARELARRAAELGHGHVDTLVNNAAIFLMGPAASMTQDVAGSSRAAASPDEIAAAITDLASDDASFVRSTILPVGGGRTAA
jgi:NAD(P)-dependent dehydrogenase (short-subunit alcohol dehydrogenase family)